MCMYWIINISALHITIDVSSVLLCILVNHLTVARVRIFKTVVKF